MLINLSANCQILNLEILILREKLNVLKRNQKDIKMTGENLLLINIF